MKEAGIRREKRKEYVDRIAAALILQGYLDRRHMEAAEADSRSECMCEDGEIGKSDI